MSVGPPLPPEMIGGPDDGGFGTVLAFVAMWIFVAYLIWST